ncbi:hypothetical protein M8C21_025020, partial [Ambrosia artemisiifolia]
QGHLNPLLRLGKLLASKGSILITLSSSKIIEKKMKKAGATVSGDPTPVGNRGGMIRFEFFDDGCSEDHDDERNDLDAYLAKLEAYGKTAVTNIINQHAKNGQPVSCLINNPFVPWVSDLAHELNIPCSMLWVQSCACFSSYYHYEKSLVPFPSEEKPELDVQLPNMPMLKSDEIPSYLHPSTPYPFLKRAILGQFKNLSNNFCVLMETTNTTSVGTPGKMPEGVLEAAGERGKVVQWSPQAKVLAHPAVSCFVTHCGWNSTMEALSSGVPVVVFPQWGDQVTNAKYLVDEWKIGIRMCRGEAEHKVIGREAVEECLREATSGVKAAEMKTNAMKWKKAAEAAVAEGGTSDGNIQGFVDEVRKLSSKICG